MSGPAGGVAALRSPAFRRVWLALLVSSTGSWMQITGRAYLVYELTGSGAALGVIYLLTYGPYLLLSQAAGVLIDRVDRRAVLAVGQAAVGVAALAIALLVGADAVSFAALALISLASGLVLSAVDPAVQAIIPALVPRDDVPSAVALESATSSASRMVGPLLAGVLIATVGVGWVFVANAAACALIAAVWATTRTPYGRARVARHDHDGLVADVRAAMAFVRRTPRAATAMLAMAYLSGLGLVYQPLGVQFATEALSGGDVDAGTRAYGFLQTALGIGAVVLVLVAARLTRRRPLHAVAWVAVVYSLLLVAFGASSSLVVACAVALALGGLYAVATTVTLSVVQLVTPDEMRGRVMSIFMVAWLGLFPVTSIAAGAVADSIGIARTLELSGVLCAACSVWLLARVRARHGVGTPAADAAA